MSDEEIVAQMREMTSTEKEQQRQSFAYGNAKIENPKITREMVEEQAEWLVLWHYRPR